MSEEEFGCYCNILLFLVLVTSLILFISAPLGGLDSLGAGAAILVFVGIPLAFACAGSGEKCEERQSNSTDKNSQGKEEESKKRESSSLPDASVVLLVMFLFGVMILLGLSAYYLDRYSSSPYQLVCGGITLRPGFIHIRLINNTHINISITDYVGNSVYAPIGIHHIKDLQNMNFTVKVLRIKRVVYPRLFASYDSDNKRIFYWKRPKNIYGLIAYWDNVTIQGRKVLKRLLYEEHSVVVSDGIYGITPSIIKMSHKYFFILNRDVRDKCVKRTTNDMNIAMVLLAFATIFGALYMVVAGMKVEHALIISIVIVLVLGFMFSAFENNTPPREIANTNEIIALLHNMSMYALPTMPVGYITEHHYNDVLETLAPVILMVEERGKDMLAAKTYTAHEFADVKWKLYTCTNKTTNTTIKIGKTTVRLPCKPGSYIVLKDGTLVPYKPPIKSITIPPPKTQKTKHPGKTLALAYFTISLIILVHLFIIPHMRSQSKEVIKK